MPLQTFTPGSGWRDCHGPATTPDRGLQFGDGLFETLRRSVNGTFPLAQAHRSRLLLGLSRLGFTDAASAQVMQAFDTALTDIPEDNAPQTGLKIIVTRGMSERGYLAPPDIQPLIFRQFFAAQNLNAVSPAIVAGENPVRLGAQSLLAGIKHLNRLEQVLARQAFEPGWDESIMLGAHDRVIEGCMSNVYVKTGGEWLTPELHLSGVAGVVRSWLLQQGLVREADIRRTDLYDCSAMAFSNTLTGIRSVACYQGRLLTESPEVADWQACFCRLFD